MSAEMLMDFSPTATQQAVADVVTSVLERDLTWEALVGGGVTALALPERLGGDGLGLAEVATVPHLAAVRDAAFSDPATASSESLPAARPRNANR